MKLHKYSTISAVYVWYSPDGMQHSDPATKIFVSRLYEIAWNAGSIYDLQNVNNVCIEFEDPDDIRDPTKKGIVFMAGGWSPRRGLFIDMYNADGERITA